MIQQHLFQELSPAERRQALEDHADKIEETTYYKPLNEDDLSIRKDKFTGNSIQLANIEDQFKSIKEDFKERMRPYRDENKELLSEIKTKTAKCEGTLYHIADQEEGMMCSYDETGDLVTSRRLRPDERQLNIHLNKAL